MLQIFRKCEEFCSAGVLWHPDYSSVSALHAAQADQPHRLVGENIHMF